MSEKDKLLEMASSSLSDAKMVEGKSDRLFWNSVYYSLFYAAKAALKSYGVEPKSHSGADSQVGKILYKKEEILTADEASFYSDIRRIREEIDYEPYTSITREKNEALQKAEDLVTQFKGIAEN